MTFDPRNAGFAWPEEMKLTNVAGESMTIRPCVANMAAVEDVGHQRIGQCYRYYTSERGILTELDVFYWYAGGPDTCANFLVAFKDFFDSEPSDRVLSDVVVAHLSDRGFDETTIRINIGWLIHGGYLSLENADDGQFLSIVNW